MDAGESARELVRVGLVSSTNPEKNTVRVVFEDKENLVSSDLRILHLGGAGNKFFWMPDVNDEVVCLFPTNDENYTDGFVIGCLFNEKQKPNAKSQDVTRLDFKDGTSLEYDRKSHAMKINCKGSLEITCAKNITLKGETINLN